MPVLRLRPSMVLLASALCGCADPSLTLPPIPPAEALAESQRIVPLAPVRRSRLAVNPRALPERARAVFPESDGAPFYVTLPAAPRDVLAADQVLDETIAPILRAVGFARGPRSLTAPPREGVAEPRGGGNPATFLYPFVQTHDGTPIEHSGILASRQAGEGITAVWGTLHQTYRVANRPLLGAAGAVESGSTALARVKGVSVVDRRAPLREPALVLLPYGGDANGAVLRYAWRLLLAAQSLNHDAAFLFWLDAEDGRILKLDPLLSGVSAQGPAWDRNPGRGVVIRSFEVGDPSDGMFKLEWPGVFTRIDYSADGFNALDVSVSNTSPGSSPGFANFNQPAINDPTQAVCANGTNKALQQINVYAALYRYREAVRAAGIFEPFPETEYAARLENPATGCNAFTNSISYVSFGFCAGYTAPSCPDFWDSTMPYDGVANGLNLAHDNTIVAHEFGHAISYRLTRGRPAAWCGAGTCPLPVGWAHFHDLADFFSANLEATNCIGDWFGKNIGSVNGGTACASHTWRDGGPRLLSVAVPFTPANVHVEHFPESIGISGAYTNGYGRGQVAGAALWETRAGMYSLEGPAGAAQFSAGFQWALARSGFLGSSPPATDAGLYAMLYDLQWQLLGFWARESGGGRSTVPPPSSGSGLGDRSPPPPGGGSSSGGRPTVPPQSGLGSHLAHKVTAGFARGGLFLIPRICFDGDPTTADPLFCPGGEQAGDAVVDIVDSQDDDIDVNGTLHRENDYLKADVVPSFLVWTGPRYRLDGPDGKASFTSPAPCNGEFKVEVSSHADFAAGTTLESPWTAVDRDTATAATPECFGTWTPSAAAWAMLATVEGRVYYRAQTRDVGGGSLRVSTNPGGLWALPPPFAVISPDGRPLF